MTQSVVAVLGANGHTARFVIVELKRRGVQVLAATRTGLWSPNGVEIECSKLDFDDEVSLDDALAGADAVINCAGPFFDTALPAARAAIRAGIPYLDIAAEQATVLSMFEVMGQPATEAGICIIPAMAFYGGLADLMTSAIVNKDEELESVEIAVGLSSWLPTRGTRLTGERNTFERLVVRGGKLVPAPVEYARKRWAFSGILGEQPVAGVQLSEVILISHHIQTGSLTSYMNLKPLADLHDAATLPPTGNGLDGKSDQDFVIEVEVTTKDGRCKRATASGQDIYAATAPLVVTAYINLLEHKPMVGGVLAPGQILEAQKFLLGLQPVIEVQFYGDHR